MGGPKTSMIATGPHLLRLARSITVREREKRRHHHRHLPQQRQHHPGLFLLHYDSQESQVQAQTKKEGTHYTEHAISSSPFSSHYSSPSPNKGGLPEGERTNDGDAKNRDGKPLPTTDADNKSTATMIPVKAMVFDKLWELYEDERIEATTTVTKTMVTGTISAATKAAAAAAAVGRGEGDFSVGYSAAGQSLCAASQTQLDEAVSSKGDNVVVPGRTGSTTGGHGDDAGVIPPPPPVGVVLPAFATSLAKKHTGLGGGLGGGGGGCDNGRPAGTTMTTARKNESAAVVAAAAGRFATDLTTPCGSNSLGREEEHVTADTTTPCSSGRSSNSSNQRIPVPTNTVTTTSTNSEERGPPVEPYGADAENIAAHISPPRRSSSSSGGGEASKTVGGILLTPGMEPRRPRSAGDAAGSSEGGLRARSCLRARGSGNGVGVEVGGQRLDGSGTDPAATRRRWCWKQICGERQGLRREKIEKEDDGGGREQAAGKDNSDDMQGGDFDVNDDDEVCGAVFWPLRFSDAIRSLSCFSPCFGDTVLQKFFRSDLPFFSRTCKITNPRTGL